MSTSGTVVVLAAHPDDEALGASALLSSAAEAGCDVAILLFTAGENSHPRSSTQSAEQIGTIRIGEFHTALRRLGSRARTRVLDFPDGGLADHRDQVFTKIMSETAHVRRPITIVAPFSRDGHSDHESLGAAALDVGRRREALVLEYPIWYWHWAAPDDELWRSWRFLPDPAALDRRAVLDSYPSQTTPLSDLIGDEAILSPDQIDHYLRGGDTFSVTDFSVAAPPFNDANTAAQVFDEVHTESSDPWSVRDSEYEIAKRRTLLDHLPRENYSHILEIGCSIGVLSRELASRSRRVTALDASPQALRIARKTSDAPNLDFVEATVPFDWPEGVFDCVVLSETGFYLSRCQLNQTLRLIAESTTPRFVLVLCHWTGEIRDWPLDADIVHDSILEFLPHHRRQVHINGEYRLDIVIVDDDNSVNPLQERS
nr:PIG-L family deacetylase [Brevibacterium permense]